MSDNGSQPGRQIKDTEDRQIEGRQTEGRLAEMQRRQIRASRLADRDRNMARQIDRKEDR